MGGGGGGQTCMHINIILLIYKSTACVTNPGYRED